MTMSIQTHSHNVGYELMLLHALNDYPGPLFSIAFSLCISSHKWRKLSSFSPCTLWFQIHLLTVKFPRGPPGGCAKESVARQAPSTERATSVCNPPTTVWPVQTSRTRRSVNLTTASEDGRHWTLTNQGIRIL